MICSSCGYSSPIIAESVTLRQLQDYFLFSNYCVESRDKMYAYTSGLYTFCLPKTEDQEDCEDIIEGVIYDLSVIRGHFSQQLIIAEILEKYWLHYREASGLMDYQCEYCEGYSAAYVDAYEDGRRTLVYSVFGDLSAEQTDFLLKAAHKTSNLVRSISSMIRSLV